MGHKPVPLQGGESNYPPFIDQRTTVKQKKSIGMDNYHFRKTFILGKKPQRFVIHLTGDNRYKLLVNGRAGQG